MEGLYDRHEHLMGKMANKRVAVKHEANKLRVAYEDRMNRRATQQFDNYGNEIFYDNYGNEVYYDDYGNEIFKPKDNSFEDEIAATEDAAADEGVIIPEEINLSKPPAYYENMLYGIIDGMTGSFDPTCASSLYGLVNGSFRMGQYYRIYEPTSTIKFQLALANFTESTNSMYAFCDFTHFYAQLAMLADTEDWEQYIQIGSRVSGSLLQSVPRYMKCIK